jgi:hypothetical protein
VRSETYASEHLFARAGELLQQLVARSRDMQTIAQGVCMEMKGCFAHSLAQARSFTGHPIHVIILLIQSNVAATMRAFIPFM